MNDKVEAEIEEVFAMPAGLLERLTRACLVIVKEQVDGRPWHTYTEDQQTMLIMRIEDQCAAVLERATDAIASRNFPAIPAVIKHVKYAGEGQIEAPLILSKSNEHAVGVNLSDYAGGRVLVVPADIHDFLGTRGKVRPDKDQGELELPDPIVVSDEQIETLRAEAGVIGEAQAATVEETGEGTTAGEELPPSE